MRENTHFTSKMNWEGRGVGRLNAQDLLKKVTRTWKATHNRIFERQCMVAMIATHRDQKASQNTVNLPEDFYLNASYQSISCSCTHARPARQRMQWAGLRFVFPVPLVHALLIHTHVHNLQDRGFSELAGELWSMSFCSKHFSITWSSNWLLGLQLCSRDPSQDSQVDSVRALKCSLKDRILLWFSHPYSHFRHMHRLAYERGSGKQVPPSKSTRVLLFVKVNLLSFFPGKRSRLQLSRKGPKVSEQSCGRMGQKRCCPPFCWWSEQGSNFHGWSCRSVAQPPRRSKISHHQSPAKHEAFSVCHTACQIDVPLRKHQAFSTIPRPILRSCDLFALKAALYTTFSDSVYLPGLLREPHLFLKQDWHRICQVHQIFVPLSECEDCCLLIITFAGIYNFS